VLLIILFVLIVTAAYYIGGVVGFYQGSASAMYLSDSDAYSTSLALIKLRNEDYRGAIDLLETRLDTEILHCGTSEDSYKSLYNMYWLLYKQEQKDTHGFLLSSVAEYRSKYPSINMLPEVRQQIENILAEASKEIENQNE